MKIGALGAARVMGRNDRLYLDYWIMKCWFFLQFLGGGKHEYREGCCRPHSKDFQWPSCRACCFRVTASEVLSSWSKNSIQVFNVNVYSWTHYVNRFCYCGSYISFLWARGSRVFSYLTVDWNYTYLSKKEKNHIKLPLRNFILYFGRNLVSFGINLYLKPMEITKVTKQAGFLVFFNTFERFAWDFKQVGL